MSGASAFGVDASFSTKGWQPMGCVCCDTCQPTTLKTALMILRHAKSVVFDHEGAFVVGRLLVHTAHREPLDTEHVVDENINSYV